MVCSQTYCSHQQCAVTRRCLWLKCRAADFCSEAEPIFWLVVGLIVFQYMKPYTYIQNPGGQDLRNSRHYQASHSSWFSWFSCFFCIFCQNPPGFFLVLHIFPGFPIVFPIFQIDVKKMHFTKCFVFFCLFNVLAYPLFIFNSPSMIH